MINLLLALAAGVVVALLVHLAGFGWLAAVVPAVLVVAGVYVALARRIAVKVQALAEQATAILQGIRKPQDKDAAIDKAIKIFESGFELARWQFFIEPTLHGSIGQLLYMKESYQEAKPHLEKAFAREWMAKCLLGCIHYMAKDDAKVKAAFEEAVTSGGKKEPMAWAAYAWCLEKLKKHDDAIAVAGRAVQENPSDEKLKKLQNQLQNNKTLKMNAFEPMWWNFGLEKPPMQMMGSPYGGRFPRGRRM